MKTWVKALMWFGLGAGLGFFGGYQLGQAKREREVFEKPRNTENDIVKLTTEVTNKGETIAKPLFIYRGGEGAPEAHYDVSTIEGIEEILHEPVTDDDDVPDIPTEEDVLIDPEIPQLHPQHLIPEIISEEDFNLNIWGYELQNLILYEGDGVLYNASVQQIVTENPDDLLGIGTLLNFGGDPKNPVNELHVKNDTFGVLFKIERVDGAFCEEVDGSFGPEDDDEDYDWDDV